MKIGIRKETQYPSERRAALTPEHVKKIVSQGIEVIVESAEQRIFTSKEYISSGAQISENLEDCDVIFGVKEVPIKDLIQNKPFVFFSHTIKGQSYNMPLLQAILDKKITLMDYELVKGDDGLRIIFFGKFAGYAGVIDSLWLLGKRLNYEGIETPINKIMQATEYDMLDDAEEAIKVVGAEIAENGLPDTEMYRKVPSNCTIFYRALKLNPTNWMTSYKKESSQTKLFTKLNSKKKICILTRLKKSLLLIIL